MTRVKKLFCAFCVWLAWSAVSADTVTQRSALLEAAKENLRVTEAAERRISDEYASLSAAGALSADEIEEYLSFLQRIRRFVERYRLEVAVLSGAADQDSASAMQSEALSRGFSGEQTEEERTQALDAELNASLGDFDEMLLREQEELSEKARTAQAAAGGGASGGSAGAGGGGASGAASGAQVFAGDAGAATQTSPTQSDPRAGASGAAARAETGAGEVADAGGYSKTPQKQGTSPGPADIPDGGDDDIVARQLREAAEKESDPALREKLWDEYRKYKNATR